MERLALLAKGPPRPFEFIRAVQDVKGERFFVLRDAATGHAECFTVPPHTKVLNEESVAHGATVRLTMQGETPAFVNETVQHVQSTIFAAAAR